MTAEEEPLGTLRLPRAPKVIPSSTPATSALPARASNPQPSPDLAAPSSNGLVKIAAPKAASVCGLFSLSEPASQLLSTDHSPKQFLQLLMEKTLYTDATRFVAHSLPKADAVRWGSACLREAYSVKLAGTALAAVQAAEKWANESSDDTRKAAMPAAEASGFGSPAGLLALAAYWSDGGVVSVQAKVSAQGKIAPALDALGEAAVPVEADLSPEPPDERLTAEMVIGAVSLLAAAAQGDDIPKRQRRFLDLGLAVAGGG